MKLSKTQLHKLGQSGRLLGRLLGPLLKIVFLLMKNVLNPLAKGILIQLELTAAAATTDAVIQKKKNGSGMTTLIISNENMKDIMKIVKSLEESGVMIKGLAKKLKIILLGVPNVIRYIRS